MNNKLTDLKKCDKCMGIGIFECEHNTSTKINMPDIKQRAHKMFMEDERFESITRRLGWYETDANNIKIVPATDDPRGDILSFIDEIIDIAVSDTQKAFGGCKLCYGKGYATVKDRTRYHADFIGDKGYVKENNPVKPCSCDRGKQIKTLLAEALNIK